MKVRLLKKVRSAVKILNNQGVAAKPSDRRITIKVFNFDGTISALKTTKGKVAYMKYGNAINRRRVEIVKLAKEINQKSKLWHVIHR